MKTAHIISHTHWDREWYLPYEKHHMRLVMLIDQILDAIDNDPDFKSFHLDGQTICVDDYLQVKPQNRERLMNAISHKKINIGPWYILQDAFLTSAEANVRNGYYGDLDCQRYGGKTSVGYYPDTFGIYAQAPQILKELDINNMIFGRGVSTTGFNNKVSNDFESKYSEMIVKSSNETEVLGILFANWYSNGNEIPVNEFEAKKYWDKKLAECEMYTNSNHLLFMNGCDHTPYQASVTEAIKVANELYPDVEFIQSSFDEYLKALTTDVKQEQLSSISGELTSQNTDGLYTLVNTASSRISQKISNARIQNKYEFIVEPLSALYDQENYPHAELEYGWKKLMQNHPHDSICGCSVDSVHRTMNSRFEDSENVADHVIENKLKYIKENIEFDGNLGFAIINPSEISNTRHSVIIEYKRQEFGADFRAARDNMKELSLPNFKLIDANGDAVPVTITDLGLGFDYYLPDDKFRRAYYSRNIKVDFAYNFTKIGHQTFKLIEDVDNQDTSVDPNCKIMENDNIRVTVNSNGSIDIFNKSSNQSQSGICKIYDQGDVGNEYMFGSVKDDKELFLTKVKLTTNHSTAEMQQIIVLADLEVPKSADSKLTAEQLEIIDYNLRDAQRSEDLVTLPIEMIYSLNEYDRGIKIEINIDNQAKDHRVRARFELVNSKSSHQADSAFETVTRANKPLDNWKNKNFDNRMLKFMRVYNAEMALTIATNGLHEYEVGDNYVDITLLRAVGELGDWGYFPTPEAQCIEQIKCELYVIFDSVNNNNVNANVSRSIFVNQPYVQLVPNSGKILQNQVSLRLEHDNNSYISAIKRSVNNELIVRIASNGEESYFTCDKQLIKTNMLELVNLDIDNKLGSNEILTLKVKE